MELVGGRASFASRLEELRPILENLPQGVVVAEAPTGAVVYANPSVHRLIGTQWRAPDAVAEYGADAVGRDETGRELAPTDWALARALRKGEVVREQVVHVRRHDGQHWVLSLSAAPFYDRAGQIEGAICVFEDQTERRASDAFRASLLEGISDAGLGLIVTDGRRVLSANDAMGRMAGRAPEELVGMDTTQLVPQEERDQGRARQDERLSKRRPQSFRCHVERPDGTRLLVEVTGKPLRSEPPRFLGIVRDLTDEELARERGDAARRQIAQSEKLSALGSLVSGVAHEVRTPLTYLQNDLHLLSRKLDRALASGSAADLAATREQVDSALEAADRIRRLVEDLRRFTRLQAAARERVPLDVAVREAVVLFRATHRGRLDVGSDLHATPGFLVDSLEAQQVVLNLLQNAADASPAGAPAFVRTMVADERAVLEVEDAGGGIPPEVLPRMFDPFFTTKADGTGLGLSIVQRIAESHGAEIRCESAPGRTVFAIRFPKGI